MPKLVLYPFKFRDRITGKWVRARHKLQVPALQRRYSEWEITGPPEIRDVTPGDAEPFSPFRPNGPFRWSSPSQALAQGNAEYPATGTLAR